MIHLKTSKSPLSPKRGFLRNAVLYLPAILIASLVGTYLDLIFVGKSLYAFPIRPFPDVFSINIAFTLLILPFSTWIFLLIVAKMPRWSRFVFILLLSILASVMEKMSVQWGFFHHTAHWNHSYSFVGYLIFLVLIWKIFKWGKRPNCGFH